MNKSLVRHFGRVSIISMVSATALFLIFLAMSYFVVGKDTIAARQNVDRAFDRGYISNEVWIDGNTTVGAHQWNDCLALVQVIDNRGSRNELAVSPLASGDFHKKWPCEYLRGLVSGEVPKDRWFYHQYIHGSTTLLRYLVRIMNIDDIRAMYKIISYSIISIGFFLSLVFLVKGKDIKSDIFWILVFAIFPRWYGLEQFGQSLAHGPADIIIFLYLLALRISHARGGISSSWLVFFASAFGALTMIFEWMTGGIPLGLAVVIGTVPFAVSRAMPNKALGTAEFSAILGYCGSIVTCAILKLAAIIAVFGTSPLTFVGQELALRMGADGKGEAPDISLFALSQAIIGGLNSLSVGTTFFTGIIILGSLSYGTWGIIRIKQKADNNFLLRAELLALSNLPLLFWFVIFWQHTVVHAHFMDRILVWVIVSGYAIFALAVLQNVRAPNELGSQSAESGKPYP